MGDHVVQLARDARPLRTHGGLRRRLLLAPGPVGNAPYDIYGDGTGSDNTVSGNSCHSTNLGGC